MNSLNQATIGYFLHILHVARETGHYLAFTPENVLEHVEEGDLVEYLSQHLHRDLDLGFLEGSQADRIMNEFLAKAARGPGALKTDYPGIHRGIDLIIAWLLEMVDQPAKKTANG